MWIQLLSGNVQHPVAQVDVSRPLNKVARLTHHLPGEKLNCISYTARPSVSLQLLRCIPAQFGFGKRLPHACRHVPVDRALHGGQRPKMRDHPLGKQFWTESVSLEQPGSSVIARETGGGEGRS